MQPFLKFIAPRVEADGYIDFIVPIERLLRN